MQPDSAYRARNRSRYRFSAFEIKKIIRIWMNAVKLRISIGSNQIETSRCASYIRSGTAITETSVEDLITTRN
jgi:hypothetical protein